MQVTLSYAPAHGCWTFVFEDVNLRSAADIDRWKILVYRELEKLKGRRAYLLVDMRGFRLHPDVAPLYGEVARDIIDRHALAVVRYAPDDDGISAAAIRLAAIKQRFASNIFPSRNAALEALDMMRSLPAVS